MATAETVPAEDTAPPTARVEWEHRAAYLGVLRDLKRAIDRECDAVQVGADETVTLGLVLEETWKARVGYRGKVRAAK